MSPLAGLKARFRMLLNVKVLCTNQAQFRTDAWTPGRRAALAAPITRCISSCATGQLSSHLAT